MKIKSTLAILLMCFAVAPLGQAADSVAPFDVMDVSYLWPADLDDEQRATLQPIVGVHLEDDLIPSREAFLKLRDFSFGAYYQELGYALSELLNPFTGKLELNRQRADSWHNVEAKDLRVIAFRVENCGDGVDRGDGKVALLKWHEDGSLAHLRSVLEACKVQLRLVAQESSWNDSALHLIYTFNHPKKLDELILDLVQLREKSPAPTAGKPLGVHPGLEIEKGKGPFTEAVKAFISKHAKPQQLTNLAFLATNQVDGGTEWNFFEAEVQNENGVSSFVMRPLHALVGSPISQGFSLNRNSDPSRTEVNAFTKVPDDRVSEEELLAMLDPRKSFNSQVDCKSCHSTSKMILGYDQKNTQRFERIFSNSQSLYYTKGITGFPNSANLPTDELNFRAFGWFFKATVNSHVAMKSATAAAALNQRLLGRPNGPGPDCTGQVHRVMPCLFSNAGETSNCVEEICRPMRSWINQGAD